MAETRHTLLICSVGGSPEPVVAALKHWQPSRVRFVCTPQSKGDIPAVILARARDEGMDLDPGRYEILTLRDGQDLSKCLDDLRRLTPEVTHWDANGGDFQVVVDFTGGTKCMSASLAIQASRWPCQFSYVGGTERTREGVGVVVSGAEKILYQDNPWDALGHQAVDDFVVLFNQQAFGAAQELASRTRKRVSRQDRRSEFSALESLARGFDAWDQFDHQHSRASLREVLSKGNDLRAALGYDAGDMLLEGLERIVAHLDALCQTPPPSRHHVIDLLANAGRRRDAARPDDAVARLYRAIEATLQLALKEGHGLESTEKIPLDRVPEPLRGQWAASATDGVVTLALQNAYELLAALGDPAAERFKDAGLSGEKSPLTTRNRSILAQGFERVPTKIFEKMWTAALMLARATENDLPSFPRIDGR